MSTEYLFAAENPLEGRLGSDFFENLPQEPGVYKMYGKEKELLYVGKAKNLRSRLFTYRRVGSSDNGSEKIKRLIRMITAISIEQLPTEQVALLRENELIRQYRPPFNHAKKTPETYYFVTVVPEAGKLVFDLRMHRRDGVPEKFTFGAFKGHRTVRRGMGALLRQLYIMQHQTESPFLLPSQLLNKLTPMHFEIRREAVRPELIFNYLRGNSDQLLYKFIEHANSRRLLEQFIGKLILKDMEALRWFYDRCSKRNSEIIKQHQLKTHLIQQEKLDDYLVGLAFKENSQ